MFQREVSRITDLALEVQRKSEEATSVYQEAKRERILAETHRNECLEIQIVSGNMKFVLVLSMSQNRLKIER